MDLEIDPENYHIRKLGNCLELLKHAYPRLGIATRKQNRKDLTVYTGEFEGFQEFNDLYSPNQNLIGCWYQEFMPYYDYENWHYDWCEFVLDIVTVVAYPYPTQFLIPKQKVILQKTRNFPDERQITDLLSAEMIEILTPDCGDVYEIGGNVVHRTNPKTIGHSHLVFRTSTNRPSIQRIFQYIKESVSFSDCNYNYHPDAQYLLPFSRNQYENLVDNILKKAIANNTTKKFTEENWLVTVIPIKYEKEDYVLKIRNLPRAGLRYSRLMTYSHYCLHSNDRFADFNVV